MDGPDDNEADRLRTLRGYGVLDTPNEAEFDAIVREAAATLGAPIALISLVDEHRQWFKARVGLDVAETPRSISFCTHAIRGEGLYVIENAEFDSRTATNPLVTGQPDIRFYAGMPLKAPNGRRIGTLCVIDRVPHAAPTEDERAKLATLAARAMAAFEKRRRRLNLHAAA